MAALRQNMSNSYEQFSGKTLERYFKEKFMETGAYTMVGNWLDRNGVNEIDMIALNEFEHKGIVAEIKRNPDKISITTLEEKVLALPKEFDKYNLSSMALSIEDM